MVSHAGGSSGVAFSPVLLDLHLVLVLVLVPRLLLLLLFLLLHRSARGSRSRRCICCRRRVGFRRGRIFPPAAALTCRLRFSPPCNDQAVAASSSSSSSSSLSSSALTLLSALTLPLARVRRRPLLLPLLLTLPLLLPLAPPPPPLPLPPALNDSHLRSCALSHDLAKMPSPLSLLAHSPERANGYVKDVVARLAFKAAAWVKLVGPRYFALQGLWKAWEGRRGVPFHRSEQCASVPLAC